MNPIDPGSDYIAIRFKVNITLWIMHHPAILDL